MMERSLFLTSLAALLVAPTIPRTETTLGAVYSVPFTLDEHFRAALGDVVGAENVEFRVFGPLDTEEEAITLVMSIHLDHYYLLKNRKQGIFHYESPELLADALRQDARHLGEVARNAVLRYGGPVLCPRARPLPEGHLDNVSPVIRAIA